MSRHTLMLLAGLLVVLLAPARAASQAPAEPQKPAAQAPAKAKPPKAGTPTAKPAPAAPQKGAAPAAQAPAPPVVAPPGSQEGYTYRAEGRRDPFVSLMNRGTDPRQGTRKAEGLAGLSAADISLKGIMQSKGQFLAIVQGPDGKRPYIVHPNDRFADGVVKAITADSMLILQEVNDPLSLTKQREIRKTLRAVEEVK
jgi:Tfp pilus assembly protein PilP